MTPQATSALSRSAQVATYLAKQLLRVLLLPSLALPITAYSEVHPYQRWADELGIDLNASYDGTRVLAMTEGQFESTERRAPGKMYTEMHIGGVTTAVILREDLKKSYILMPSMGFYKEESLEGGVMQTANGMEFSKIEKAGTEEILGYPSTKYKTQFKDNEGKGAGIIWVTDTGVPIKFDMMYSSRSKKGQRFTMEFTELNMREQNPSHFELPPDLKPMGIGSVLDMMKMGGSSTAGTADGSQPSRRSVTQEQKDCLQQASDEAAEERAAAEQQKGFGRLMGSIARTADKVSKTTKDILAADGTNDDVAVIAGDFGISEEAAQDCMRR
jgi:hypothetical protein